MPGIYLAVFLRCNLLSILRRFTITQFSVFSFVLHIITPIMVFIICKFNQVLRKENALGRTVAIIVVFAITVILHCFMYLYSI